MRAEIRSLLGDFKAAARIGHPESLGLALDGLRALPEIASNQALPDSFLDQVILPLGQALVSPMLPSASLKPLLDDPLAGVRAAAAVALGLRFFMAKDVKAEDLIRPGRDPRAEVRQSLAGALARGGRSESQRLLVLLSPWLRDASVRLRQTALLTLASAAGDLAESQKKAALDQLEPLHAEPDTDMRAALAAALTSLARSGAAAAVLDQLASWAAEANPNDWVIAKTLSASWAVAHSEKALAILQDLEIRSGPSSAIQNARRALERHGKS